MIKIAIANQSKHIVEGLLRSLSSKTYEISWVVDDLSLALENCKKTTVDILLVDISVVLPKKFDFIKKIVEEKTIVLLTTQDIGLNSSHIFEAMGQGALDVISLKGFRFDEDPTIVENLIRKIENIESLIGHQPKNRSATFSTPVTKKIHQHEVEFPIIAIGASTGGPLAISKILETLPVQSKFAVIIVQHIDQTFIPSLVAWLNDHSKMPVEMALVGEKVRPGIVYLANRNDNLTIDRLKNFSYNCTEKGQPCTPSIDAFFESLEKNWTCPSVAILLTGMGKDGAKGLKRLKDKGWHTIAQDEETCVVFGMSKAAIQLGAAKEVLPVEKIGLRALKYL